MTLETIIGLNEKPVSLKNGIVVHDASIDDDNEFESYDHSHACLGRLCIHTQKALTLNTMIKPLLEILKVLQQHQDATVKHAGIYAYARSLFSIDETHYDDLIIHFIELKCLLDYIIIQDTNTEVQKLARSVRQI
ncbi:unnamed protein product [Rotaria sp. Silwood1]|nr:unnamed protein product [Rotaria sp. Silwood1]